MGNISVHTGNVPNGLSYLLVDVSVKRGPISAESAYICHDTVRERANVLPRTVAILENSRFELTCNSVACT